MLQLMSRHLLSRHPSRASCTRSVEFAHAEPLRIRRQTQQTSSSEILILALAPPSVSSALPASVASALLPVREPPASALLPMRDPPATGATGAGAAGSSS